MKKAGWTSIAISVVVIIYNVVIVNHYNNEQVANHPFITLLSGGANLKDGYTFEPPYSAFEVFIMALGVAGVVILLISKDRNSKS